MVLFLDNSHEVLHMVCCKLLLIMLYWNYWSLNETSRNGVGVTYIGSPAWLIHISNNSMSKLMQIACLLAESVHKGAVYTTANHWPMSTLATSRWTSNILSMISTTLEWRHSLRSASRQLCQPNMISQCIGELRRAPVWLPDKTVDDLIISTRQQSSLRSYPLFCLGLRITASADAASTHLVFYLLTVSCCVYTINSTFRA